MSQQIKSTFLYIIGSILIFLGLMIFFIALGMTFDTGDPRSKDGPPIAVASFALTAPGVLVILAARRMRRELELVESVASITKSYRRITLVDLAVKLQTSIPRAHRALNKAITAGLVTGNFDRTTDEFFTQESTAQSTESKYCASCGAPLDRVYLSGETIKCGKCGAVF